MNLIEKLGLENAKALDGMLQKHGVPERDSHSNEIMKITTTVTNFACTSSTHPVVVYGRWCRWNFTL